ncbi:N-acetylneuraminate synthase [Marinospirillum perlucidum]|uniref:N-acetylneuraminate synthase n=1 Tax=Marinospirillum perlucidum TaxID=1982602 RepID=UPI000DF35E9C|nr:N-acetylneuraminate synthase [Marinospirillum perlucidum]
MSVMIIAEAGVNHNGDRDLAFQLVDAAAESGADAVKFQTFNAERLAAVTAPKAQYQKNTTDEAESQLAMLKKLELPESWHEDLQDHAQQKGIAFISTAFDRQSLSFLQTLNLPFYKIPSGEITNAPLLWDFAATGKPCILSTGMATLSEVEQALAILAHGYSFKQEPKSLNETWEFWSQPQAYEAIKNKVTLLHCTSCYPTPLDQVNLKAMDTLATAFQLPVGYSDHTQGLLVSVAAVARGAKVIEKHFTLDRELAGPDHKASLEPDELKELVQQVRSVEQLIGTGHKAPHPGEWDTRKVARQNLLVSQAVQQGKTLNKSALTTARTGQGISAIYYWDYLGTPARKDYKPGEAL